MTSLRDTPGSPSSKAWAWAMEAFWMDDTRCSVRCSSEAKPSRTGMGSLVAAPAEAARTASRICCSIDSIPDKF